MKKSIISKILFQLKKKPLTFTQLRALCYKVSKGIHLNKKIPNSLHAGFYSDAIQIMAYNGIIAKKNKKYYLTEKGILNIKKPYSKKPLTNLNTDYADLKRKYEILKANNESLHKSYLEIWRKFYKGPSTTELNEAIEYFFVNAFVEELTTDKFFYVKLLLDKAAALTGCKLDWSTISHHTLNRKVN